MADARRKSEEARATVANGNNPSETRKDVKKAKRLSACGLLLHPAINQSVDETVIIQGHCIRFATVDLTASTGEIRAQLLRVCEAYTRTSVSNYK